MPLFDYTCRDCTRDFELLVRGSETPKCPTCQGDRLVRHLAAAAVHGGSASAMSACASDAAAPCGPGFCRTGRCQFD